MIKVATKQTEDNPTEPVPGATEEPSEPTDPGATEDPGEPGNPGESTDPTEKPGNPDTGVNGNFAALGVLLCVSAAGIIGTKVCRRKRK